MTFSDLEWPLEAGFQFPVRDRGQVVAVESVES